ncbi:MAG: DUF354 domain-containing protein [Candidatus Aenigmarchaeota archaeon]|nr:DUF354 domain-containing protein [Candidatus Aenigmarchaeota archaeon]
MKIWIDLTSLPHIHFFRAFIKNMGSAGNDVLVTSREFGMMNDILDKNGIDYVSVGSHGGKDLESKLVKSSARISELAKLISREKPDIGLSKHSVECARVSFGLGIPSIMVMDHETANAAMRLMVPLTGHIVAPKAIPLKYLTHLGAQGVSQFYGVCELAHFYDFKPKDDVLEELGLRKGRKIVIARSEPMLSAHNDHESRLYGVLEGILKSRDDVDIVFIPRGESDTGKFSKLDLFVPEESVDTLSLYSFANLMIGAGSCMNREASIGGCPTISICPDKLPAVDRLLISKGVMWHSLDKERILRMATDVLAGKMSNGSGMDVIDDFGDPYVMINEAMRRMAR